MKIKISFVAAGDNGWGRGPTLKVARAQCRAAGGTPRDEFVVAFEDLGDETYLPHVDAMGALMVQRGATTVRIKGKPHPREPA